MVRVEVRVYTYSTVVERRSLAGELSLFCARPASDDYVSVLVARGLNIRGTRLERGQMPYVIKQAYSHRVAVETL